jgi:hypothetical protein
MNRLAIRSAAALFVLFAARVEAQALPAAPAPAVDSNKVAKFYRTDAPLLLTLTTNIRRIRADKDSNPPWRAATLTYDEGAKPVVVPVRIRSRGIWRLKTCDFPPLRFNFSNSATKKTIFHGLDRPKLVNYCRDDDVGERYLLQEFQLYRIYRLLTPASHAVRLVRISFVDSATRKVLTTRYSFFEEDPEALAGRMGGRLLKIKGANPDDLEPFQDGLVGVFQYMIGNTDFALSALHNAELIGRTNGDNFPIVYDFDFSGAVNARYATVDPRLRIHTVRQRLYRGFCVPEDVYPKVFARFNAKKDAIYGLYHDSFGKLLPESTVDETLQYFDEFYKTINDPRKVKSDMIDLCLGQK